jgi:hypothetical protein
MFMNSPNYDSDYLENPEANKFAFIDRYMLDVKSWDKDKKGIEKIKNKISWGDK